MAEIYSGILDAIEKQDYNVFAGRSTHRIPEAPASSASVGHIAMTPLPGPWRWFIAWGEQLWSERED